MSEYLITPPALYEDPPVDDFPGEPLPVGGDDEPWAQKDPQVVEFERMLKK